MLRTASSHLPTPSTPRTYPACRSVTLRFRTPALGRPGTLSVVVGRCSLKVRTRLLRFLHRTSVLPLASKTHRFLFSWLNKLLTLNPLSGYHLWKRCRICPKVYWGLIWEGCPREILPIHSSRVSEIFPWIEWSKQTKSTYMHFIILVLQIFPNLGGEIRRDGLS